MTVRFTSVGVPHIFVHGYSWMRESRRRYVNGCLLMLGSLPSVSVMKGMESLHPAPHVNPKTTKHWLIDRHVMHLLAEIDPCQCPGQGDNRPRVLPSLLVLPLLFHPGSLDQSWQWPSSRVLDRCAQWGFSLEKNPSQSNGTNTVEYGKLLSLWMTTSKSTWMSDSWV